MHKSSDLPAKTFLHSQTASIAAVDPGMVDGQDAPREPLGRILLATGELAGEGKETPGGTPVARGAPWAPNDQDDIGDNTQHILPPPQAQLTRSYCHLHLRIPTRQENLKRV